jgi:hypothetical protein
VLASSGDMVGRQLCVCIAGRWCRIDTKQLRQHQLNHIGVQYRLMSRQAMHVDYSSAVVGLSDSCSNHELTCRVGSRCYNGLAYPIEVLQHLLAHDYGRTYSERYT